MSINSRYFNWKKGKLYHGSKFTGYSIKPAEQEMFRVCFPDGVLSEDFYNRTWAREHCTRIVTEDMNKTTAQETRRSPYSDYFPQPVAR